MLGLLCHPPSAQTEVPFLLPPNFSLGAATAAVVAADLDGDTKPDLAVAAAGADFVSILLAQGNGAFSEPKRIALFSYGSGLASSMFSAKIVGDVSEMVEKLDLKNRLEARTVLTPKAYDEMCQLREHAHLKKNFKPSGNTETLFPGTYYLTEVDDMFRRKYEVKA